VTGAVLDHLAIGTGALTDGWDLFGGVLGGTWAYGGYSPGFWWGQLEFGAGPKIELITPTGGPDSAFLERFLAARGAGPHHFNFLVPDIHVTLARIRALGLEPVQVNLASDAWKDAFLHPRSAHGIVIQVAQQIGAAPSPAAPADFPAPGAPSAFDLIEHYVADLPRATRLFERALDGQVAGCADAAGGPAVEVSWPGGRRLRLVQPPSAGRAGALPLGGALHRIRFTRADAFTAAEAAGAELLSRRLGLSVELAGPRAG
jgi:methylmalonyl-CoA/ethylmalonyl-CoA epimerase